MKNSKKAVIFYGPPGSGKGTQAKLLAERLGLVHFDTGKYIEQVVHDPANKKNKTIQKQRKLFDSGALCEPSWVLNIVSQKVRQLALSGSGVVFSGSPRTLFEAFGGKKQRGLMDVLEKLYGKKNIFVFLIDVSFKNSLRRNGSRLMCSVCGTPLLSQKSEVLPTGDLPKGDKSQKFGCPFCGGKLYRRTLDKPEIIKIRIKEYKDRTLPIAKALKKRGHRIIRINGEPLPYKVHQKIYSYIK